MECRPLRDDEVPDKIEGQFALVKGKWIRLPPPVIATDNIQPSGPQEAAPAEVVPPVPAPEAHKKKGTWMWCHACGKSIEVFEGDTKCPSCYVKWKSACKYHANRKSGCRLGDGCRFWHFDKLHTSYWRDPSWDPPTVTIDELPSDFSEEIKYGIPIRRPDNQKNMVQCRTVLASHLPEKEVYLPGANARVGVRGTFTAAIPLPDPMHFVKKNPVFQLPIANQLCHTCLSLVSQCYHL